MKPSRSHSSPTTRTRRLASARTRGRLTETLEARTLLSAGDLDPSFAGDGTLFVENDAIVRSAEDVAVQSDGKIVVVGTRRPENNVNSAATADLLVSRYNANGTLDATFGTRGQIVADLGAYDAGNAVKIDAAGRIVVGATLGNPSRTPKWAVLRYLPNGTPDSSFGTAGKTTVDAGQVIYSGLYDLDLAPDGKIVAAGGTAEGGFSVMRFTADGRLDTTFGGDGKVAAHFGTSAEVAYAVAVAGDGKVVASGYSEGVGAVVARFNADGTPDASFDGDGRANAPLSYALDVALDSAGRVVLAGANGNTGTVARLTATGQQDGTFGGGDGVATASTPPGSSDFRAIAIAPGGSIVAAGYNYASAGSNQTDVLTARFTSTGAADPTFNGTGWAIDDFYQDSDRAEGVAVAPGGKVVAAGSTTVNGFTTEALVRYNADGSRDATFDGDGKLNGPFEGARREVYDVLVQPDRKIVVGGTSITGPRVDFYVARFNPDGSPDNSFEGNGRAVTYLGANRRSIVRALTLQPDGKIIAAGTAVIPTDLGNLDVAVVRYNPDGTLDKSFAGDGTAVNDFRRDDNVFDVALYPGGKVVVAGGPGLVRYNANGTLDNSFDGDGVVNFGDNYHVLQMSVLVQGDKILVDKNVRVVRYNANGSLDPTFASPELQPGINTDDEEAYSFVTDMAFVPGGDVIVLGHVHDDYDNREKYALWRLNPDGTLDTAFGPGGSVIAYPGEPYDLNASGLAVQGDGKILVTGNGFMSGTGEAASMVARHLATGALDHSYGIDGFTLVQDDDPSDNNGFRAEALALDPTGDAVIAGLWTGSPGGIGIARLDGAGAPGGVRYDRNRRTLTVRGTLGNDSIRLRTSSGRVLVTFNGKVYSFARSSIDSVRVYGSDGNDTIAVTSALPDLAISGGTGNDSLRGGPGAEVIDGGEGDDTLDGGLGADVLSGGAGKDTLDYRSRTRNLRIVPGDAGNHISGEAGEGDAVIGDIEKVFGGSGDDYIEVLPPYTGGAVFGGAGNDTLVGTPGPDALWGEDGDDLLTGSDGADYLRGGSGNDTYDIRPGFDDFDDLDISLDGVANDGGISDGPGGRGDNVYTDIENVIGGNGDDRITGSSANNRLEGGAGNDTLLGGPGDDTLLGGDGDDTLTDTQGNNTLDGGPGTDTINGVVEPGNAAAVQAVRDAAAPSGLAAARAGFRKMRRPAEGI